MLLLWIVLPHIFTLGNSLATGLSFNGNVFNKIIIDPTDLKNPTLETRVYDDKSILQCASIAIMEDVLATYPNRYTLQSGDPSYLCYSEV